MDLQSFVSPGLDEKLKCSTCKNYLSYFPILLSANKESLCGRCTPPEDKILYQDEAFETLCQFVKFPCRYHSEGCLEEMVPKEVPQHEQNCPFRRIGCILNKPDLCTWSGTLSNLQQHCQTTHPDMFLKNRNFKIDLSRSEDCDYLIKYNNRLLVFATSFSCETQLLQCTVYSNQFQPNLRGTTCHLSVKREDTTLLHDFVSSTFEKKQFTEVCLQSVTKRSSDQELVQGKIAIGTTGTISRRKRTRLERTHSKLLSLLRYGMPLFCFSCSDCTEGDYCLDCMNKFDVFGTKFRKMSDIIKYPCKHQSVGCGYLSGYEQLQAHYILCQYESVKCIVDATCEWKGRRKDVNEHILNAHREFMLDASDVVLELSSEDTSVKNKVLKLSNYLFRLAYCVKDTRYMWAVQSIGYFEEKFTYEVDIVDATGIAQRLLMRQPCLQLTEDEDTFSEASNYCYFDKEQIDRLSQSTNAVGFRVNIVKY